MKKISLLLLVLLLWMVPACDDDSSSSSTPKGTLTVNYDFSGYSITSQNTATESIYVYIYNVLSLFPYEFYVKEGSSARTVNLAASTGSITLTNVQAGNYYVLVFYDAEFDTESVARDDDPYMIYVNNSGTGYQTSDPYVAIQDGADAGDDPDGYVPITGGATTTINMNYDEGTGATFQTDGAWYIDTI